jgi:hypothetical protein
MRHYKTNSGPRWIKAKYAGVCAETGKPIRVGDECLYASGKVYSAGSKTAQDWRSAEFDRVYLGFEY